MDSHDSDDDVPLAQRIKLDPDAFKCHNSSGAKDNRNKYCWICHRKIVENEKVNCSDCILAFHMNCMPDINRNKIGWRCPECRSAEESDDWSWGAYRLADLLKHVFEAVVKEDGGLDIPEGYTCNKSLVNALTFDDITRKVERAEYISTHAFLMDFKWLKHNCEILHKYSGLEERNNFGPARISAKNLLKKCTEEIDDLKHCGDCYMNDTHLALQVCSKPHLVVWAQFSQYPYWPAKLLQIGEGKTPLQVLFFDDNDIGSVTYASCYLYSKEDPNENLPEFYKKRINAAMEEAAMYIANVEEKFGPFRFAPAKTKLIRGKVDSEQYDQMIPGFRNIELRTKSIERIQSPEDSFQNDSDNEIVTEAGNGNGTVTDTDNVNVNVNVNADIDVNVVVDTAPNVPDEPKIVPKPPCIPVTKSFIEKVEVLRGYLRVMKAEHGSQRAQIAELQEKNATLQRDQLIDKQVHEKFKEQVTIELTKLRNENAAQAKQIEEYQTEVMQLREKNRTLEEKMKTQSDNNFEKQTQVKLNQWCCVCLDKVDTEKKTFCSGCNPND